MGQGQGFRLILSAGSAILGPRLAEQRQTVGQMREQELKSRHAGCACGAVRFKAVGAPILGAACYCDDCQKGGARIEALPGAPGFREPDGGTPYLTYRDDRFTCTAGEDRLVDYKLAERAPTRRVVASCCNSALFLKFGPGRSCWRSGRASGGSCMATTP